MRTRAYDAFWILALAVRLSVKAQTRQSKNVVHGRAEVDESVPYAKILPGVMLDQKKSKKTTKYE